MSRPVDCGSDALARSPARSFRVVLTGNPNSGKTTLFNALTGLRAKVGNYPGVTVERKEGQLQGSHHPPVTVLDLPGTYSLSPQSLDEQVARDVLFQRLPDVPAPDLVVIVVDASNLERNLYYATQVMELGWPTLIALNMMDVARDNGLTLDIPELERQLGVPVSPVVASTREGVPALRNRLLALLTEPALAALPAPRASPFCPLPPALEQEIAPLAAQLSVGSLTPPQRVRLEALLLLTDVRHLEDHGAHYGRGVAEQVRGARGRLEAKGVDWASAPIEARYAEAARVQHATVSGKPEEEETPSDRVDRVLTHRIWGVLILVGILALMFQSIFTFAQVPMDLLEAGVGWVGSTVARGLPPGDLRSLLVDGVIAGVGAVVVFLPQICLLFLFIGLLEDTGYMARAAFLMDRLMSKVGLHGKSFIPMLSSFACAIPGIMATRTIEHPKDRLVTILVAPLMACSARLPVYTLLIAACIPDQQVLGVFRLPGLTLLGMYLLGIGLALVMAWVFKRTLLRGHTPLLLMELPPYKRPTVPTILRHMWERARLFLQRAGTVILGINILLWFLATYPRSATSEAAFAERRGDLVRQHLDPAAATPARVQAALAALAPDPSPADAPAHAQLREHLAALDQEQASARLRSSLAGRLGHAIEPLIRPLGFDWTIGIGIVTSFAAREVFVSTVSVVYNVSQASGDAEVGALARSLRDQVRADGTPLYSALTGLSLMVFYVVALQCVSTVAVVRRETNGWKWPLFQWAYLGALAWLLSFLTYQGGRLLGLT